MPLPLDAKEDEFVIKDSSGADTLKEVEAEADLGAMDAVLKQVKEEDVPKDEKELVKYIRDIVPGLEKAKDEDVLSAWKMSLGKPAEGTPEAAAAAAAAKGEAPWKPEGYTLFGADGKPVEQFSPEVQKLLSESLIGYRALGRDFQKPLKDVVRTASRGHLNQSKQEQYERDIQGLTGTNKDQTDKITQFEAQAALWDKAIRAASMGDASVFVQLVQEYQASLAQAEAPEITALRDKVAQTELRDRGQEVVESTVRPMLKELATAHGIPVENYQQLEDYALTKIGEIPDQVFSEKRVMHYLQTELPHELEEMGYATGGIKEGAPGSEGAPAAKPDAASAALQAEIDTLKSTVAALSAGRKAPPASGPGGTGAGSPDEVPEFKTQAEAFAWLRSRK